MRIMFVVKSWDRVTKVSKVIFDGGYWWVEWKVSRSAKFMEFYQIREGSSLNEIEIRD